MEWISSSEKLPTPEGEKGYYLAYRPDSKGTKICSLWYNAKLNKWSGMFPVTHWMQLPSPSEMKENGIKSSVNEPTGVSDTYLAYCPNKPDTSVFTLWFDPQHNGWSAQQKVKNWMKLPQPPVT